MALQTMVDTDNTNYAQDLDGELSSTGYSVRKVLEILEKNSEDYVSLKNGQDIVNIKAETLSGGKLSTVFFVTITFQDGNKFKCVMKLPEMEDIFKDLATVHDVECDAIVLLSKSNFPMPKTIFAQKLNNNEPSGLKDKLAPGVIMMTLLDGITISLYSLQSFTADQCLNIADDIAYLHDYIYSLDENEWRGKFMSEVNAGSDVATNFTDFAKKFSETYPVSKSYLDAFLSFNYKAFCKYSFRDRPAELGATMLSLGDCYTNNMLFKKNEEGYAGSKVAGYIDFQLVSEGNPMFDFARCLTSSVNGSIRREVTLKLLSSYYNKVEELLKQRNQSMPYSMETAQELFDLAFVHQSYFLMAFYHYWFGMAEDPNKEVLAAKQAEYGLRVTLALEDGVRLMKKYGWDQKFKL